MMKRNSNIELLRIICMFGIITMHTFGRFMWTCEENNLAYCVFINSVFNMGVTCFMLITGYYGAKFSSKKIVSLELMILLYGILGEVIVGACTGSWSIKYLIKSAMPITSKKYWYMSVYMIILCCSGFINKIPEGLDRKQFRNLLMILIMFFYLMPSFGYFQIMEDSGKGIANMLVVYLTGRYLKKYYDNPMSSKKLFGIGSVVISASFLANYLLSLLAKSYGYNVFIPFARDNSITIYLGSVFFFLAFKNTEWHSAVINSLASCVLPTYLFEGFVRSIIDHFFDISIYLNSIKLYAVIAVYVLVVMIVCSIVEFIRRNTLGKLDSRIYSTIMGVWNWICNKCYRFVDKI